MRVMGIVVLLAVIDQSTQAADLNAPLPDKPTLATEIHRGMSEARRCNFMNNNMFDPDGLVTCTSISESRNTQLNPNYKPYSLGLHFETWYWEDMHITLMKTVHDKYNRQIAEDSRKFASPNWEVVRSYQRDLGVTDDQLLQIAETPAAGIKSMKERFSYWDAQLKAIGRLPN